MYLDGISLKRSWGGEVRNVSILVAMAVNREGFREIIGVTEGPKEDKVGWLEFLRHLKARGVKGVRLVTSDKCEGLVEAVVEVFPDARWQRNLVPASVTVWVEPVAATRLPRSTSRVPRRKVEVPWRRSVAPEGMVIRVFTARLSVPSSVNLAEDPQATESIVIGFPATAPFVPTNPTVWAPATNPVPVELLVTVPWTSIAATPVGARAPSGRPSKG